MHDLPPFRPAPWAAGPHAQTILAFLATPRRRDEGERVVVPLARGGLEGRIHRARGRGARAVAILLHGAGGTGDEAYLRRTAARLVASGVDAIRLRLRGAGGSVGCAPALLHGGLTEDVRSAVAHLARTHPSVVLVGFSMGGQIALKTACEWGAAPPPEVRAIAALSPPLDLALSARCFDRPANALYRRVVMRQLRAHYGRARASLPPALQRLGGASFLDAAAYNRDLVAPAFGFRDAADYYARASSARELGAVAVPTLVLHAADDPLVPAAPAALARAFAARAVHIAITEQGGHLGFFAAAPAPGDGDRFWGENRAVRFVLDAIHDGGDPHTPASAITPAAART